MIDIGKTLGLPPDSRSIKVFRCPMKDGLWLQEGSQTINPYYGSEMLSCGAAIESLPRVSPRGPTTHADVFWPARCWRFRGRRSSTPGKTRSSTSNPLRAYST